MSCMSSPKYCGNRLRWHVAFKVCMKVSHLGIRRIEISCKVQIVIHSVISRNVHDMVWYLEIYWKFHDTNILKDARIRNVKLRKRQAIEIPYQPWIDNWNQVLHTAPAQTVIHGTTTLPICKVVLAEVLLKSMVTVDVCTKPSLDKTFSGEMGRATNYPSSLSSWSLPSVRSTRFYLLCNS